jgi:hypothetical protein
MCCESIQFVMFVLVVKLNDLSLWWLLCDELW